MVKNKDTEKHESKKPWTLRYFTYDHLPVGPLRDCSERFSITAQTCWAEDPDELPLSPVVPYSNLKLWMMENLPNNKERTKAIKKLFKSLDEFEYGSLSKSCRLLLESKDCAVRSLLPISNK